MLAVLHGASPNGEMFASDRVMRNRPWKGHPPAHISCVPTVGPYVLPSLLSHLGNALPKLKLYVREAPTPVLLDKLAGGELDILLVAIPYGLGDVETMEITEDPIVVAMPRNHALRHHKVV